jgi:NAD(P)-dependent dehydrogenase (short-subunit alcohol dehydrogenase family)
MERLGQGGAIVNMASIMGLAGGPFYPNPAYHASKGGVVNLTRAQAIEWGPKGIRVNAVAPTWVSTPLTEKLLASEEMRSRILSGTPLGRLPAAEDIANAVVFLASPAAAFITGQILAVDAGWMAG